VQEREAAELVFEQGLVDPPCRLPPRGDVRRAVGAPGRIGVQAVKRGLRPWSEEGRAGSATGCATTRSGCKCSPWRRSCETQGWRSTACGWAASPPSASLPRLRDPGHAPRPRAGARVGVAGRAGALTGGPDPKGAGRRSESGSVGSPPPSPGPLSAGERPITPAPTLRLPDRTRHRIPIEPPTRQERGRCVGAPFRARTLTTLAASRRACARSCFYQRRHPGSLGPRFLT
jgi:hypothetical protein